MRLVTLAFFWGYVAMLVGVGGAGIFVARWELTRVLRLPLATLAPEVRATLANQYRFLKAIELGFGAFCVVFRREIFAEPRVHALFLFVLFAGVAARALSIAVDGRPHVAYVAFTVLELATGVLVLLAGTTPA